MIQYSFLQEIYLGEYKHKRHTYEVHIRQWDNGNKFHCHIIDKETQGDKFHTCVELFDNRYYWHEGKTDVLDSKMRTMFNTFMRQKYTGKRIFPQQKGTINNWQALCYLWNQTNNKKIDPKSIYDLRNIPDYSVIKPNSFSIPKRKR